MQPICCSVIGAAGAQPRHLHRHRGAALRAGLAASNDPLGPGGASTATNQPPLYYALEAIPYWLSPSNDILTRLGLHAAALAR